MSTRARPHDRPEPAFLRHRPAAWTTANSSHPETGYYAVGIKSYGRAPTFLMATGYEQVRSVVAFIAGDYAAADDVRLVLPETGVCSIGVSPSPAAAAASCCPPPASAAESCTGTRKEGRELVAATACCGRLS